MYDRQIQKPIHKINTNDPQDIETEEDLVSVLLPPLIISSAPSICLQPEENLLQENSSPRRLFDSASVTIC